MSNVLHICHIKNGSENRSEVGPVLSGRSSWEELLPKKVCRKEAPTCHISDISKELQG